MRFSIMIQALSFIIKKASHSVRQPQCLGTGKLGGHFVTRRMKTSFIWEQGFPLSSEAML